MADRRVVHPHHLMRAVLPDPFVRDVLAELGVAVDQVQVTLEQRWLAAADTIELEEIEALGIDVATVLSVLNPPYDGPADWGERQLSDGTRDLLVRALAAGAHLRSPTVTSGHLLVALVQSRDPIVSDTFAAHGVRTREVRTLVGRWARRAG